MMPVTGRKPMIDRYTATADQTTFSISYEFLGEIDVYVNDTYKATSTYTVSGSGFPTASASVIFNTGLSAGDLVVIVSNNDLDRTLDFAITSNITGANLNDQFDKIWLIFQELRSRMSYLGVNYDDTADINNDLRSNLLPVLPPSTDNDNYVWSTDSTGKLVAASILNGTSNLAQAYLDTTSLIYTTNLSQVSAVMTLGFYAKNDGAGALWINTGQSSPSSAGINDFANGVLYDSVGTKFIYGLDQVYTRKFGAKGDGAFDDSDILIEASDFSRLSKLPFVHDAANSLTGKTLDLTGIDRIEFVREAKITYAASSTAVQIGNTSSATSDVIVNKPSITTDQNTSIPVKIIGSSEVTINNPRFIGPAHSSSRNNFGIFIDAYNFGAGNIKINTPYIRGFQTPIIFQSSGSEKAQGCIITNPDILNDTPSDTSGDGIYCASDGDGSNTVVLGGSIDGFGADMRIESGTGKISVVGTQMSTLNIDTTIGCSFITTNALTITGTFDSPHYARDMQDGKSAMGDINCSVIESETINPAADNSFALGSASKRWTEVYAANGTINTSDRRLKTDISPAPGLEFINKLNPVKYHMDKDDEWKLGLIAQEVEDVDDEISAVVKPNSDHGYYGIRYNEFISPLIKSVQELSQRIEALENAQGSTTA